MIFFLIAEKDYNCCIFTFFLSKKYDFYQDRFFIYTFFRSFEGRPISGTEDRLKVTPLPLRLRPVHKLVR